MAEDEKPDTDLLIFRRGDEKMLRVPLATIARIQMPLGVNDHALWVYPPNDDSKWFLGAPAAQVLLMGGGMNYIAHMHPDSGNAWRAALVPIVLPPRRER